MKTVTSADGTPIAFEEAGNGPHLVLVHGTGASSVRWRQIRPVLEQRFSVITVDRRGRGDSGDHPDYALEREFEDVAAVVASLDGPALLFGHSFGGVCAVGAVAAGCEVAGLILYEAPLFAASGMATANIEMLERLLATGDREAVVEAFIRDIVGMPQSEFEQFRASPAWPARVAAAHTIPRELRAADDFRLPPSMAEKVSVPVLLLVGGESPPFFADGIARYGAALADARTVKLPGQRHVAMDSAPELLTRIVVDFQRSLTGT